MKISDLFNFKKLYKIWLVFIYFLLTLISSTILSQGKCYGQYGNGQFIITGGVGYTSPLNDFKNFARYGKGIELNMFWELSNISDKLDIVMLTSVNQFSANETFVNSTIHKKFTSLQQLDGLVFKFKPIFLGGGFGFTLYSNQYLTYVNSTQQIMFNQFVILGINPVPRVRLFGKYIFARSSDQSLLDFSQNFNSISLSINYNIFNSNNIF